MAQEITMKIIIEQALIRAGISKAELARRLDMTPQRLHKRLITGRFTYAELKQIAEAMGGRLSVSIEFD